MKSNNQDQPSNQDQPAQTVKVIFPFGITYNCIVALCDIEIGITLVDARNKAHNICCLNGPMSPNKSSYQSIKQYYEAEYDFLTQGLAKGVIDLKDSPIMKANEVFGPLAPCATGMGS